MSKNNRFLYVGGLSDEVDLNVLKTVFSPFGDIVDINLPMDYTAQKHKGFAFIEFQWPEDAADAIDNLDNGEIMGKTIRVNVAKPHRINDSTNSLTLQDAAGSTEVEEVQEDEDEDE